MTEHTTTICIELSGLNVPYQLPPNSSVKPIAFKTNVDYIWDMLPDFERAVAKKRGLI